MNQPPFPETHQLNSQLQVDQSKTSIDLYRVDHNCTTLPGQPRVRLSPAELCDYLEKDLSVPKLNQLAPWLWLVHT